METSQITPMELLLHVRKHQMIWYHKDTKSFDHLSMSAEKIEYMLNHQDEAARTPMGDGKDAEDIPLPNYEQINHKEIMSFYVREFVEDKESRKQLFNILRRGDYMDAFLNRLQELNLYDDFKDAVESIYDDIFAEWVRDHDLSF